MSGATGRKLLKIPDSNVVYELLSPSLNHAMEIVTVNLRPGDHTSDVFFCSQGGGGCYVLSGKITVMLGETSHVLEQGDCVQFQAELPHK